jgi:hypothetical protein
MRAIQKIIIVIYGILVAVACIYVPWIYKGPNTIEASLGYSLIWKPLRYESTIATIIDLKRVFLEIIAITAIFAIFFVLTLRPKRVLPGS